MKVNSLLVSQCMFDIVALSETWLEKEIQFERFRYFGVHRKKSKNGRTYGGVAIFVSENFLSQHEVQRLKSVSCNLIK